MAWAVPQSSKNQVDRAGQVLADSSASLSEIADSLQIINNWRSSHSFPLNTIQVGLRSKVRQVYDEALVAQRIKRLASIEAKLIRFPTMKLSQMQDIGGCRAVVKNVLQISELVDMHKKSAAKHKLVRIDNYIESPQRSGYRGVHLIYKYFSDRNDTYNGLQVEIQIRSLLQHAWATAVETVGTFLKQALKSSQGHSEWLRFFALMSSAIAWREKTQLVPNTSEDRAILLEELRRRASDLDVLRRLAVYGDTLRALEDPGAINAHYFVLALDPIADTVTISGYSRSELERATSHYVSVESKLDSKIGQEAVLVSVDSISALKKAYPNYFLDTKAFLVAVEQALAGK